MIRAIRRHEGETMESCQQRAVQRALQRMGASSVEEVVDLTMDAVDKADAGSNDMELFSGCDVMLEQLVDNFHLAVAMGDVLDARGKNEGRPKGKQLMMVAASLLNTLARAAITVFHMEICKDCFANGHHPDVEESPRGKQARGQSKEGEIPLDDEPFDTGAQ